MANPDRKRATKRLMADLQELQSSPVENVTATPLEDNMLEWHCNIMLHGICYHLIIYFPDKYPFESPSAEICPIGFNFAGGASKTGKKGTEICVQIFSNYNDLHGDWKNDIGGGWSTAYTVQIILITLVAFLEEKASPDSHYTVLNNKLVEDFECADCGHKTHTPYPAFISKPANEVVVSPPPIGRMLRSDTARSIAESEAAAAVQEVKIDDAEAESGKEMKKDDDEKMDVDKVEHVTNKPTLARNPTIVDYISKEPLSVHTVQKEEDVIGFGLSLSRSLSTPYDFVYGNLTTPGEFISAESYFDMQDAMGQVESTTREKLIGFLPLILHSKYGPTMRNVFEKTMSELKPKAGFMTNISPSETLNAYHVIPHVITSILANLAHSGVVAQGPVRSCFMLHHLYLWYVKTYPSVNEELDKHFDGVIADPKLLNKRNLPSIVDWLLKQSFTSRNRKETISYYMRETMRREFLDYVTEDYELGRVGTPDDYRAEGVYHRTKWNRKLTTYQIIFLNIAMPKDATIDDVISRYDENSGFPTSEMVAEFQNQSALYNKCGTYEEYFKFMDLPLEGDVESMLVSILRYCLTTKGYYKGNRRSKTWWGRTLKFFDKESGNNPADANDEKIELRRSTRKRNLVIPDFKDLQAKKSKR